MLFICYIFHLDFKDAIKYTATLSKFLHFLWKLFFPGQTPVPPRSGTWILDLSQDPIWATWLAEVSKFHQNHDRIYYSPLRSIDVWIWNAIYTYWCVCNYAPTTGSTYLHWNYLIEYIVTELPYVTRTNYRGVSWSYTGCRFGGWRRRLTTCSLKVVRLFGESITNGLACIIDTIKNSFL